VVRSAAARLPDPLRPADSAAAPLHPAFGPYARWYGHCAGGALPSLATLNAWAVASGAALADGRPIAFVAPPPGRLSALDYERWIARRGEIPTRGGSRHDACNALAWLAFPRAKSAVNAIHVAAAEAPTANGRDRRRDAATLLDESGMIVACAEPALLALWREHDWSALFWERRAEVARAMRPAARGRAARRSEQCTVTGGGRRAYGQFAAAGGRRRKR